MNFVKETIFFFFCGGGEGEGALTPKTVFQTVSVKVKYENATVCFNGRVEDGA